MNSTSPTTKFLMPPYLIYMTFIEYVVQLIAQLVAVTLFARITYMSSTSKTVGLSLSFRLYLMVSAMWIALATPYVFYMVVKWRPDYGKNFNMNVFNV